MADQDIAWNIIKESNVDIGWNILTEYNRLTAWDILAGEALETFCLTKLDAKVFRLIN